MFFNEIKEKGKEKDSQKYAKLFTYATTEYLSYK